MNAAAVERTIRALERAPPERFTMRFYRWRVGVPACIAAFVNDAHAGDGGGDPYALAASVLGLRWWQARRLFWPEEPGARWDAPPSHERDGIDRERALACLERLRRTGRVSWRSTPPWWRRLLRVA